MKPASHSSALPARTVSRSSLTRSGSCPNRCRMSPDKLAYMANQIGRFFAHQPHDKAVAAINDHIQKFWDPRMRGTIVQHLRDVELDPSVREAVEQLRESQQE